MYKVDIKNKTLIALSPTNFESLGLKERFDIQEWIAKTPSILGEDLLVIGKEVILSSGKRIDLLCIDIGQLSEGHNEILVETAELLYITFALITCDISPESM